MHFGSVFARSIVLVADLVPLTQRKFTALSGRSRPLFVTVIRRLPTIRVGKDGSGTCGSGSETESYTQVNVHHIGT